MLLFLLPLMVPPITYGIPLATVLYKVHLAGTICGVILANLIPAAPFVILVMTPFIEQIDPNLESAARVFGASTAADVLARAGAAARARHPRRVAARAGAHDRAVRADVPHRRAGFADARRRAVLRGVRRRRARAAVGRRDGDDLHGGHADLAADRAALRQSDAARVAREGASAAGDASECQRRESARRFPRSPICPPAVARPRTIRARSAIGIVHLGIGAFHRAHQAVYTDDALASSAATGASAASACARPTCAIGWRRRTASTRRSKRVRAGARRRVIGSVREVLFLGDQRDAIRRALLAAPRRASSR